MTPEVSAERRVLVVEDEPDLRELLTYNLEAAGFTVHATDKGLEGLVEAQGFAPDVILLDLMLPDIPGTEVCRRIRAGDRSMPQPAIVMLTAKGDEIDRVVGFELGADGYHVFVGGDEVHMSAMEMRLLIYLVEHRGRVRSREDLLEDVWGYKPGVSTRTVDTHVKRLRDKLGEAGTLVETVRGMGYRLSAEHPVVLGGDQA